MILLLAGATTVLSIKTKDSKGIDYIKKMVGSVKNKNNFNKYLEAKINDDKFVNEMFTKLFK